MRPASGTWGSMPPVVIAGLIWFFDSANGGPSGLKLGTASPLWWAYHGILLAILVVFSAACVVDGNAAEARFGKKDPGQVVADETAGQCLSLMALPFAHLAHWNQMLLTLALAFVSFRVMDIVKPWPARQLQRVPGGWGILIDDLFAGLYAMIVVQVVTRMGWIGH